MGNYLSIVIEFFQGELDGACVVLGLVVGFWWIREELGLGEWDVSPGLLLGWVGLGWESEVFVWVWKGCWRDAM